MFNRETKSHYPEVFLRPKETINIPFKYLCFAADQSVKPQGPVDPFRQEMKTKARTLDALRTKAVKVHIWERWNFLTQDQSLPCNQLRTHFWSGS